MTLSSVQNSSGQERSIEARTGRDRSGQLGTGQDRSGQVRTGQIINRNHLVRILNMHHSVQISKRI